MKYTIATVAALAASASASFSVIAARSASPIHLTELNARGLKFYIGGETSSYCPTEVVAECPAGNTTILAGGEDTLSLDVEVPGGQQVYIAPDGSLSYTQAHSANKPTGSIVTGFTKSEGSSFGYLSWTNGFIACPTNGTYQVFGQVSGVNFSSDCLGFDALTTNRTGPGAWQYA